MQNSLSSNTNLCSPLSDIYRIPPRSTHSHPATNSDVRHRDADTLATTTTMCNRMHSYAFREYIYECKHICMVECARFCAYGVTAPERPGSPRERPMTAVHLDRYTEPTTVGHHPARRGEPHDRTAIPPDNRPGIILHRAGNGIAADAPHRFSATARRILSGNTAPHRCENLRLYVAAELVRHRMDSGNCPRYRCHARTRSTAATLPESPRNAIRPPARVHRWAAASGYDVR